MSKNNKKSLILSILVVLVLGIIVTTSTFAYLQWEGSRTDVSVTIDLYNGGGASMHIEPDKVDFVGLYPVFDCNKKMAYADALVTIENNTGTLTIPSFKLKVLIEPSITNSGQLSYYREHVHYAVVALETTKKLVGKPEKGDPIGGNVLDNLVEGSCKTPLSVSTTSSSQSTGNAFRSDYGKSATGVFSTITVEGTAADTEFLAREYNATTGEVQGATFRGEAYSTSYQWYRVYVWIDHEYTTTIIGNTVSDPLQNAKITVTWSEESMLQQVSGISSATGLAGGLYDASGNMVTPWSTLVQNDSITVSNNVLESGSPSLNGYLVIPEGITTIEAAAFDTGQLTGVYIPSSVTTIKLEAFRYNGSMTEVTFAPNSQLTIIEEQAFKDTKISKIELPAGVTEIGTSVFANCTSLTEISYKGTVAQWNNIRIEDNLGENKPATYVQCSDGRVTLN